MTSAVSRRSSPAVRASKTRWQVQRSTHDYASVAAFLSTLSLSLVALVGSSGVLLFILFSTALAVLSWRRNLSALGRFCFLLIFPLLAVVSTGWSDAPQLTMRIALQLMLTMGLSILIAANLSPRRLVVALFIGALALCASALPNLPAALGNGVPLASSFLGSKNQLGFAAFLLFTTSLAILFDRGQQIAARLLAMLSVLIALFFAYLSRSGGGGVSILIASLLFPLFACLTLLKPVGRVIFSSIGIVAFTSALLFHEEIQASISIFRSEILERNETLTGRTVLWDVAGKLWEERPLLGHGYAAFWRHGNLDAEALWRSSGIAARTGFNFHNVFVETKVGLGLIGLSILLVTITVVAALMIWRQLRKPSITGAFLLSTYSVLIIRSTIENGLVSQFSLLTLIWVAGAVYSVQMETSRSKGVRPQYHLPSRRRPASIGNY